MQSPVIRCVLSGSFRRDPSGLERKYRELVSSGCQVLSPHRLNFVDNDSEFMVDEAEQQTQPKVLEDHHLLAIRQSDFLWIHIVDGYVGLSSAMELGFAHALKIPVFTDGKPSDAILAEYVSVQPSVPAAIKSLQI